jgi:hypothetical protein
VSELDYTKERIAYLKLWLGILIATGISLMSWLLTNYDSALSLEHLWAMAAGAFVAVVLACVFVHREINVKIAQCRRL